MTLLHLDSSILGDNSVSRRLSAAIVARLVGADPSIEVVYRDLAADPLDHLTQDALPAVSDEGRAVLDQFLAADIVVVGAAFYNFTVPSQLKAWIDRILIAGETFRYTATGPEGLAGGRRVIVGLARGGLYGADTPNAAAEHAETYLRTVFGFIGIEPEFVIAEGIAIPDRRDGAIADALAAVERLPA